jgi:hypothetical protein
MSSLFMPTLTAASSSEHFRLIGAGNDADGERSGEERGHADEALVAHEMCGARQQRRGAEIDKIDDQKLGQAAEERRIGFARRAGEPRARESGPGDQRAERGADQESAGGDKEGHRRALKHGEAPPAGAEAEDAEDAHRRPARTRRPFWGAARFRALRSRVDL